MCWHLCSEFTSIYSFLHIKHHIVLILFAPAKHCKFFFWLQDPFVWVFLSCLGCRQVLWKQPDAFTLPLHLTGRLPLQQDHLCTLTTHPCDQFSRLVGRSVTIPDCAPVTYSLQVALSQPINLLPHVCCLTAGWTVKEPHYLPPCFLLQGPHALHSWKTSVPSHPHSFQWMEFHPYLPTPWTPSVVVVVVAVVVVVIICVTFSGD